MKNLFILICFGIILYGCGGCSKSARIVDKEKKSVNTKNGSSEIKKPSNDVTHQTSTGTVVKMEKVNGVYQIPVEINDNPMYFIMDTGASHIFISQYEADILYNQGSLGDEDFAGTLNFRDATGKISEGTVINLKKVKISNIVLENIQASVTPGIDAPLLFGQSALEKFGKISIDYERGEITFE